MFHQLPLGMSIPENMTFENFIPGPNRSVTETAEAFSQGKSAESFLYLWGREGVGKTHLLQAMSHMAAQSGRLSTYIPLKQFSEWDPALLQDLQLLSLICIDDISQIAGQPAWEEALFGLYQHALETKANIVWAADAPPVRLPVKLRDLQSRLSASLVLEVQDLSDTDKIVLLQRRAEERGLELPKNVAQYLLSRYPRQISELIKTLDKLDKSAWIAQRALTIPFVKEALSI